MQGKTYKKKRSILGDLIFENTIVAHLALLRLLILTEGNDRMKKAIDTRDSLQILTEKKKRKENIRKQQVLQLHVTCRKKRQRYNLAATNATTL